MAEEVGIDAFGNPRGLGIVFDNLPNPAGGIRLHPIGLKQIRRPPRLLVFQILREFPAKALRKQDPAIFVPLPLLDPEPTAREIDVDEAELASSALRTPVKRRSLIMTRCVGCRTCHTAS